MNGACGMGCGPGSSIASRLRVERGWCKRQIEVWNRLAAHVWSETEHTKTPTCRRQINNPGWSPKRPAGEPFMESGWMVSSYIKERLEVLNIQRELSWWRLRSCKRHDKLPQAPAGIWMCFTPLKSSPVKHVQMLGVGFCRRLTRNTLFPVLP
jgi:hypothetical protein